MVYQVKDTADFKAKLAEAGDKLVVVDFFATWCGPCKTIAPKLVEIASSNPDVVFLKVDVDNNGDIAAEYDVSAMPTFVFIKSCVKVDDLEGANEDKLREKIAKLK